MDVPAYLENLGFQLISSAGSTLRYFDPQSGAVVSYDISSQAVSTSFSDEILICGEMVFDGSFTHSVTVQLHGLPSIS